MSIVRPFKTFGPRQSARAVIPTIIAQLASGMKQLRLGSLTPVRDLSYVEDTAAGFMAVAESTRTTGELVNIGSGKGISVGDLACLIAEPMSVNAEIVCDTQRIRPDNSEVMQLSYGLTRSKASPDGSRRSRCVTGCQKPSILSVIILPCINLKYITFKEQRR